MSRSWLLGSSSLSSPWIAPYVEKPENLAKSNQRESQSTSVTPEPNAFAIDLGVGERGIIISNPMKISTTEIFVENSDLDDLELRRALLFWDKIVWPSNNGLMIGGGPDVDFLISSGILQRPHFKVNGSINQALVQTFTRTFFALDDRSPGRWLMSNGERSLRFDEQEISGNRGALCHLVGAVPVPNREVPLEDILSFKAKRRDEVLALRAEIDGFYQGWVNSEDKDHALQSAVNRLDAICADMIRVARESPVSFSISSWRVNFGLAPPAIAAIGSKAFELSAVNTLLAVGLSTLSVGKDIGLKRKKGVSPFNYVASIERELF